MNKLTEELAVVAWIEPGSQAAGTEVLSDAVDMENVDRLRFVLLVGAWATVGGTLTAGLKGSADNVTYVAISSKAFPAGTFDGLTADQSIGTIEVSGDEIAALGYRYVKLSLTPTGDALVCGAVGLASMKYNPASEYNISAVSETID